MSNNNIERAKKEAVVKAVEDNIERNMIVGIGSGSTIIPAVEILAKFNREKNVNLKCIPTSYQSYQLIIKYHLPYTTLDINPIIDVDIDGADEIDKDLNLIKGGGGCLVQEKIVASNSKKLIIVADYRKSSNYLGEKWKKGIPIEVIPIASTPILLKLEKLGGHPLLRMASAKAGPLVSDNGNFIIDADFGVITNPSELNDKLLNIPGVVDTGLFIAMTTKAYIGKEDGSVIVMDKEKEND